MRAGQNPAKFVDERVSKAERITVALITYIPYLHGYYASSLDVLQSCITSLRSHSELPYDLLIFDNASGPEARAMLEAHYENGQIDYLILSKKNIGKGKAWDFIFHAAPGEIIAYADSDVYFRKGWLKEAIRLLEAFPKVGMVTCRPMRTYPKGHTATLKWAHDDPKAEVTAGDFIDWETFREHDVNLGQDEEKVRERFESSDDIRIEYQGEIAYAGAAHWQFVAYKSVLQKFLPLGIDRPLGDDRKLDDALNQDGYLRLMTTEPLVRHLGNTLPVDLIQAVTKSPELDSKRIPFSKRFLAWPPLRRILLGLYNRIFRWYFYQ
jgi:glycosyltransferase involved in cell wall biosynthesis